MGLDIGYTLYKNDDGKLSRYELPENKMWDTWSCGRCECNYAWSYGSDLHALYGWGDKDENNTYYTPTFTKEFDDYVLNDLDENSSLVHKLKYIPFSEFKEEIENAINEVVKGREELVQQANTNIKSIDDKIREYRDLQIKCTENQKFAFKQWQEKVEELQDDKERELAYINEDPMEDYDYQKAMQLSRMLKDMQTFLDEGYIITTFYSD